MSDFALLCNSSAGVNPSYIKVKVGKIIASLTNCSIALRFKTATTNNPSGGGWALYCERAASGNDIFKIEMHTTGKIGITHRDDAGTLDQDYTLATYNDSAIHHLVFTKSGTTIKFYLDDGSPTTFTLNGGDTMTDAIEAWIAGDKADNAANFYGTVDSIKLWNVALTAGNVTTEYNGGDVPGGQLDKWLCDDGSGTSVADSVGANTGELLGTNIPTWVAGIDPIVTSIKTVFGLAQVSVKTVLGLAIASVKTIEGLA